MATNGADQSMPAAAGSSLPAVRLKTGCERRVRAGHPWVYSNELDMAPVRALEAGSLIRLLASGGEALGIATFNPHSLIAARLLTREAEAVIDSDWLGERLRRALELRRRLVDPRFCRLVHAEADGLPGLVVDRFGPVVVAQLNSAGIEGLWPELEPALRAVLEPETVVLAGDAAARRLEGLEPSQRLLQGPLDGPLRVEENGLVYLADPLHGQKTGWFYDQRDNRALAARLAAGARVLDAYCYSGGFALVCAKAGAAAVLGLDRSQPALDLAAQAAALNGLDDRCSFRNAEVFAEMARLVAAGERFELVIADPPAFARSKRELGPALKGYRKLARLAAAVTAPRGFLLLASCSHHVSLEAFRGEVARGLWNAGRQARILREAGAGPDHPVHPLLPESAYLKALVLALD